MNEASEQYGKTYFGCLIIYLRQKKEKAGENEGGYRNEKAEKEQKRIAMGKKLWYPYFIRRLCRDGCGNDHIRTVLLQRS